MKTPPFVRPETLDYATPDANGYVPDQNLIGERLRHLGNGKTYVVTGFSWLGATDEWGFCHHREPPDVAVSITRPVSHLGGNRANEEPRYERLWREVRTAPRGGSTIRIECSDGVERVGKYDGKMFEVAPGAYVLGEPSTVAVYATGWMPE